MSSKEVIGSEIKRFTNALAVFSPFLSLPAVTELYYVSGDRALD